MPILDIDKIIESLLDVSADVIAVELTEDQRDKIGRGYYLLFTGKQKQGYGFIFFDNVLWDGDTDEAMKNIDKACVRFLKSPTEEYKKENGSDYKKKLLKNKSKK